jgi:hypothetical protein
MWHGSFYCCPGINCLGSWNGILIAGGAGLYDPGFEMVGAFDGASWRSLNFDSTSLEESYPSVECLVTWQGKLVAGGWFRLSRDPSSSDLAVYDGTSWQSLGSGIGHHEGDPPSESFPEGAVLAMAEFHGSLYVAGEFRKAGLGPSSNIARWDP